VPGILDSEDNELQNAVISKQRSHNSACSSVDVVLQNLEVSSHRVTDQLLGGSVIMLATLGRVCIIENNKAAGGKTGSDELSVAGDWLRGWLGALLIPFIGPTCDRAALEPSSASSLATGEVDCCAGLRILGGWGDC
jgi:hypothetical protein